MKKMICPYGATSFHECHDTRKNWKEWPPECYKCCEAAEKEIAAQYGDPEFQSTLPRGERQEYIALTRDGVPMCGPQPSAAEAAKWGKIIICRRFYLTGNRLFAGRDFPTPRRVAFIDQYGREEYEDIPCAVWERVIISEELVTDLKTVTD